MSLAFKINADGTLHQHKPLAAPAGSFDDGLDVDKDGKPDPLMFGLQVHPKEKLVYISFVSSAKLGVYQYDDEGQLSFVRTVPNNGSVALGRKLPVAPKRRIVRGEVDRER